MRAHALAGHDLSLTLTHLLGPHLHGLVRLKGQTFRHGPVLASQDFTDVPVPKVRQKRKKRGSAAGAAMVESGRRWSMRNGVTFLRDCAAARVCDGVEREMAWKLFPAAYSAAIGVLRVKLSVIMARGLPNRLRAACRFVGPAGKEAARRGSAQEADRRARLAECLDFHRLVCGNAGVAAGLQRPIPPLVQ